MAERGKGLGKKLWGAVPIIIVRVVPYYDEAGDDDLCFHVSRVVCETEADAAERVEAALRGSIPSAHILHERTEARPLSGAASLPSPDTLDETHGASNGE